jgi:hypothetical protein
MTESSAVLNSSLKSNFLIKFGTTELPNLEYYVRTIPLPGYNISTNTVHSTSAQPIEYYGGMLTFGNDISFDVILDEKYAVRKAIDDFMFSIRNQKDGLLDQKWFDISLFVLSNKANPLETIRYNHFLMKSVSEISGDVGSDDYQYFTITGSIWTYEWL